MSDNAELVEVIRTTILRRGSGRSDDPVRIVEQYWSKDGVLLAHNDPEFKHVSNGRVLEGFKAERERVRNPLP